VIHKNRAALYLRSSKDRADVSISAQRRELTALAAARDLTVVAEYSDTVESAKDENRPGFQRLLADLKSPERAWVYLLMVDTSRLSRRRYLAQVFKHEARKRGVTIVWAHVPDVDPITAVIVDAVLEAFDEVHSLMSREKGLAGMRENVLRGYRAGGRAPLGYRLEHIPTGATREGVAVTKSRLVLAEQAPALATYLSLRASGLARSRALEEAGLRAPKTTLIGIERNALTYAGHTVWNVHADFERGAGYRGGSKYRSRDEWVIQRETHPALITEAQAELILAALEQRRKPRRRSASHVLTGVLVAPTGERWEGSGAHYRLRSGQQRGRYVGAAALEAGVVGQMAADMSGRAFAQALVKHARSQAAAGNDAPLRQAQGREDAIARRISKTMALASDLADPGPALREVDRLEAERKVAAADIAALKRERAAAAAMAGINEESVSELLADMANRLATVDRERIKDVIGQLVDRITLDPATLECQIHYRIAASRRDKVASPRVGDLTPTLRAVSTARVA
jgi:DNA invertase Pin-like site-specific DNA recombinase